MVNQKSLILALFILQPWLLNGLIRFDIFTILYCIILWFFRKEIKFPVREFLFLSSSLVFVSFFTIIHNEFDISLFKRYITLSVLILGGYYIVNALNISKKDLINSLYLIIVICFVFYILSIQFDLFRQISLLLKGETYGIENKLEVYRLWFPTSAHTFHLGLFFVVAMAILLCEKSNLIIILLCIICASIAARSALLMSILLCITYIFLKDKKYIFVIIALLPIAYFSIVYIAEQYTEVKYALEPIENFLSSGEIQSKSSDDLLEKHLFMPEFKTFILGDGLYTNEDGTFYMHTDSGVIRPILYGGIIFQLFYFLFLYRYISPLLNFGLYGFITIVLLYVANIKAEILSTTPYLSLLVVLYYINKKEKYNVSNKKHIRF
ncbi:MAG: hypothetical protein LBE52_02415 [Providencia sp.]|jgi:hypothetical protein|nr:hypothetical protein [Providencia sp.]